MTSLFIIHPSRGREHRELGIASRGIKLGTSRFCARIGSINKVGILARSQGRDGEGYQG